MTRAEESLTTDQMERKYYCSCSRPRVKIVRDDRGEQVEYCKRCWKPLKDKAKENVNDRPT